VEDQEEFQGPSDPMEEVEPGIQADIDALIHQGYLLEELNYGGHSFLLRTLTAREGWAASAVMRPYTGTLAEPRTYMAAIVGLALVSVDMDENFHMKLATDSINQHALKRLNYVGEWDDIVIDRCYAKYLELDQRRNRAREAIQDLPPRNPASFLPSADSLTEPGTFSDVTLGDPLF
jgi:hypothetical protein